MSDFSKFGIPSEEWLKVEASQPPSASQQYSTEELRDITNRGREELATKELEPIKDKITTKDYSIPTRDGSSVPARTYRSVALPPDENVPIFLYFHGGGYLFGTLDSENAICTRIAANVPVVVLNVNYRHTPEHRYPTAWNDGEDAFDWARENAASFLGDAQRIVVGGISAGGQIAATLTSERYRFKAESRSSIVGQVLMIPALVHLDCYDGILQRLADRTKSSPVQNENAPVLPMTRARFFTDLLQIAAPDPKDIRLNPGLISGDDVKAFPPTTFGIAGYDILRDEALIYAKLLAENGVPTNINVFSGVPHGFRRYGKQLPLTAKWDTVIEEGIRWALSKPKATNQFVINVH